MIARINLTRQDQSLMILGNDGIARSIQIKEKAEIENFIDDV